MSGYSYRGTPDKPALFNLERLLEWNDKEREKGNDWLALILWSLNRMDRHERFFDPEWSIEQWSGEGDKGIVWIAREKAKFLREWAERLEKWAEAREKRGGRINEKAQESC